MGTAPQAAEGGTAGGLAACGWEAAGGWLAAGGSSAAGDWDDEELATESSSTSSGWACGLPYTSKLAGRGPGGGGGRIGAAA